MTPKSLAIAVRMKSRALALCVTMLGMVVGSGIAQAGDITVVPASLSPAIMAQRVDAPSSQPKLTNEFLASYVARQQRLKEVDYFDVKLELTENTLLSYIARQANPALDAIEGADLGAAAALPALNVDVLSAYAEQGFVPTVKKVKLADGERECLAEAIYFEARGESVEGQYAVANIIINRALNKLYPSTICGVVYQNADRGRYQCQFTFACDGRKKSIHEPAAWANSIEIAENAFAEFQRGDTPGILPKSALFYHTTAVAPAWSHTFRRVAAIGSHVFYAKN